MTSKFQELIRDVKLTKSEKALADYIISNFRDICFLTSTELAEKVGISHSSVIRFAKDLGFKGYTAFQDEMRKAYDEYLKTHDEAATVPLEKLHKSLDKLSTDNLVEALKGTTLRNLHYTVMNNAQENIEAAARALVDANMKYIIGYRGCAGVASFLEIMLRDTLPHVFANGSASLNSFDFLSDISEKDALLIITYPRYNKEAFLSAQLAKERGASVIVMTDSLTAPVCEYADQVLLSDVDSLAFFNSMVAPMFLAEWLCDYVAKIVEKGNEGKLKLIDKYTRITESY